MSRRETDSRTVSAGLSVEWTADTPPAEKLKNKNFSPSQLTSERALSLSREASIFSLVTDCSHKLFVRGGGIVGVATHLVFLPQCLQKRLVG